MPGRIGGWMTNRGAWAARGYRIARWLWVRKHRMLALLVTTATGTVSGAEIHPQAKIGRGLGIMHGFGVVITADAEIGEHCTIMQGVTLGVRSGPGPDGRYGPKLGNRVFIGANAVLLGPITIGDDAKIGAGAVVLCDVPPGCTAVGNPARILPPKDQRTNSTSASSQSSAGG